jgi:hypothetical protein
MNNKTANNKIVLITMALGLLFGTDTRALNYASEAVIAANCQTSPAAKKELARAHYLYNNDDITDKAAVGYKKVFQLYPSSCEAETARYYYAAYFQRKHFINLERKAEDKAALKFAEAGYADYIKQYGNAPAPQWLADTYFNLALLALQRNDEARAREQLKALSTAATKDKSVYLYQIIWSPKSSMVIDWYAPAATLASVTTELLNGKMPSQTAQQASAPRSFNERVAALTDWCKRQRTAK